MWNQFFCMDPKLAPSIKVLMEATQCVLHSVVHSVQYTRLLEEACYKKGDL